MMTDKDDCDRALLLSLSWRRSAWRKQQRVWSERELSLEHHRQVELMAASPPIPNSLPPFVLLRNPGPAGSCIATSAGTPVPPSGLLTPFLPCDQPTAAYSPYPSPPWGDSTLPPPDQPPPRPPCPQLPRTWGAPPPCRSRERGTPRAKQGRLLLECIIFGADAEF